MAAKKDAATELAEGMLQALEAQRALGSASYPLTLKRLGELADGHASTALIEKAAAKRSFQKLVVIARSKNLDAPLAMAADVDLLAGSRFLLDFLLQALRTPSNQALSVAQLKAKVSSKLQKPLQTALLRQMEQGTLPAGIGWLTVNRSRRLFLLSDVQTARPQAGAAPALAAHPPSPPTAAAEPVMAFPQAFDEAFARLDRQTGSHNFVSLVDLRRVLPISRDTFDLQFLLLRRAGRYSLSAAEGRHGISSDERAAGIMEDGVLLLYVSRRSE